jgi:uncharacterized membrane protein YkvA (DUF1232 family)
MSFPKAIGSVTLEEYVDLTWPQEAATLRVGLETACVRRGSIHRGDMASKRFGKRIVGGSLFAGLLSRAAQYAKNPDKLRDLSREASKKAESAGTGGPLKDFWDSLMAFLRLVRAYAKGEFRDIPWQKLVLIVAAILYFLTPVDVIPDFILGLGYLDDAAVIAWVVSTVRSVLDDFLRWESSGSGAGHD